MNIPNTLTCALCCLERPARIIRNWRYVIRNESHGPDGARRMPIRLKDIAAELNLSKMTISKVLRGQTDVSEDTKARVLQRARELNYRPNTTARSLRTGQTFMMGLIVPSMGDAYLCDVSRGISQAIRSAGFGLVVCPSQEDPELEQQQIELLLSRQVDAL